ncbi:MAG: phosphate-starvation-inducible PsiE family protein [Candidatus Hydrogenedentes bacterium]|nr:phosphate-starvation-inducible PsiE family protein [Candidatus Hydrogenedentota bacterium]
MIEFIRLLERSVVLSLLAMMMITIIISTVELGVIMYQQIVAPPFLLLDIDNMLEIFGFYLMVVIGLELFETIRIYVENNTIYVEVVLLVAIIAVARKVIIIDYSEIDPMMNFSIAALIIALCCGYYVVKRLMVQVRRVEIADQQRQ